VLYSHKKVLWGNLEGRSRSWLAGWCVLVYSSTG